MNTIPARAPLVRALVLALAALPLAGPAGLATAADAPRTTRLVTWDDIANDDKTPGDVLGYGIGLKGQRFSPLKQIDKANAGRLQPAWSFSFGGEKQRGQESQALVHDGVV